MTLSYLADPLTGSDKRRTVKARITTEHSMSSYGQPGIVLEDGEVIDLMSWGVCGYQVVKATDEEREQLFKRGVGYDRA